MAHVDAISRFPHLTLPPGYEETVEPDFVEPLLIEPKEPKPAPDLSVFAVNAKTTVQNQNSHRIEKRNSLKNLIFLKHIVLMSFDCNLKTLK